MTPENHTLFDWNTLDEYSDLKRLQMVFTSLPAGGLLDALCHMRSGGGRNDYCSPCSKPALQESSTSIRRWSRFAANCSAILR